MTRLTYPDGSAARRQRFRISGGKGLTIAGLVTVVAFIAAANIAASFDKTDGGEIAVVRNGGPFDNNKIRGDVIDPASGLTWIGFGSSLHKYPAQQRHYTITADVGRGDRTGVDVEQNPTSDGVEIGTEGTIFFTLTRDHALLKQFDDRFGTRKYPKPNGELVSAWDGDAGWSAFLDSVVRPVIGNNFRQQIGALPCVELLSSCALLQIGHPAPAAGPQTNGGPVAPVAAGSVNNTNITKVQTALLEGLRTDLRATLQGDFLTIDTVNLVRLTLPPKTQSAIDDTLAAYAKISEAQATVAKESANAEANIQKQRGYDACRVCGQIDTLKAIPPTVTTFAPGSGFAVTGK